MLEPHVNVVENVLISESNIGPCRPQYIWGGQQVTVKGWQWEEWGWDVGIGCLYTYRGVVSGPTLVYLIGYGKTEEKSWIKTWTALLSEICQTGPAQITLDEEDSREYEGGRSREREWEREIERKRRRWDLDTSYNPGHNVIPKPLSVFPGSIRHKGYIRTLALDFHSFLACL